MRILVISDTHGAIAGLRALRAQVGPVDYLIHAGDFLDDLDPCGELFGVPPERRLGVVGNCDYPRREPAEVVWEQGGVRFLITHGHRQDVKRTLMGIWYRARELGCQVAIFGHSHLPVAVREGEVLLFNPGSPSRPRRPGVGTVGLLHLEEGQVRAEHLEVPPG